MYLAPYASHPERSRGRLFSESENTTRSVFQRDRDRIIHSTAFRRLQYKTQVFVFHEGDHYRTRLTHSLEVSQIARSICRRLNLNEDLAEALALAHDLGHTPFGHAGENELDGLMQSFGGFDHNAQTLRILTRLENRYANFVGLNLTWETLEGVVKHNGPVVNLSDDFRELPLAISEYVNTHDLELHTFAGLEAQITSLADDIAYNNHDIDDGLRAGLFEIEDIVNLPIIGAILANIRKDYPNLSKQQIGHEAIRKMISIMIDDLVETTDKKLSKLKPKTPADIRNATSGTASFSDAIIDADKALKKFLFAHMYEHWRVNRMSAKATRIIRELFNFYSDRPNCMPPEWYQQTDGIRTIRTSRRIADFIAGMTDRFAIQEHSRLFDMNYQS